MSADMFSSSAFRSTTPRECDRRCRRPGDNGRGLRPAHFLLPLLLAAGLPAATLADAFDATPIVSTEGNQAAEPPPAVGPSGTRVVMSLALVAVLIVGLGFVYKRLVTGQTTKAGAVTLVSRSILTPKHQAMVLKVGDRLVVVGDAGHGLQPLCEIVDPAEIGRVMTAAGHEPDELSGDAFAAEVDRASAEYERPPADEGAALHLREALDRVRGLSKSA